MNLIETDNLHLSESHIIKVLIALKQGRLDQVIELLKTPLPDNKIKLLDGLSLDKQLIHFFDALHSILAKGCEPGTKTIKESDALGRLIRCTSDQLNSMKQTSYWEKQVFIRFSVHHSMAALLTKSFFNDSHWHLRNAWEGWIPALSALDLKTRDLHAPLFVTVVELFDYFSKETSASNPLPLIHTALAALAKEDLSQSCELILQDPKYTLLTRPLNLPDAFFPQFSSFTQALLCLNFLEAAPPAATPHLLKYLSKLVSLNYFPKEILSGTETKGLTEAGRQVFIVQQNLYDVLTAIKNQCVYYDDDEIIINEQHHKLGKALLYNMGPLQQHPAFDKQRMVQPILAVLDKVWDEQALKKPINDQDLTKLFIQPVQFVFFSKGINASHHFSGQRLEHLSTVVIKVVTSKSWQSLAPNYQQYFFKYGSKLLGRCKSKLSSSHLKETNSVISELVQRNFTALAVDLLASRCQQFSPPTYHELLALLTFFEALPKEPIKEQTDPEVVEALIRDFFPKLTRLYALFPSPLLIFSQSCKKIPLDFLDKKFPELKPLLKETLLKNNYFLQANVIVLAFLAANHKDYDGEDVKNYVSIVAQISKLLGCAELTFAAPAKPAKKPYSALEFIDKIDSRLMTQDLWLLAACYQNDMLAGVTQCYTDMAQLFKNTLKPEPPRKQMIEETKSAPLTENIHLTGRPLSSVEHVSIDHLINKINTALTILEGTEIEPSLLKHRPPHTTALPRLMTWFIINENHFVMPEKVKTLFLKIASDMVWTQKLLSYWHLLFSDKQTEGNEFFDASQSIDTQDPETLLSGDFEIPPLIFDGHFEDMEACFQLKLGCAFLTKLQHYLGSEGDKLAARMQTFAEAKHFLGTTETKTPLSFIMLWYERIEALKRKYLYKPDNALGPEAKHFISLEASLFFLKYLSVLASCNSVLAALPFPEKQFVSQNVCAFMGDTRPPSGVDKKAFYRLIANLHQQIEDDPQLVGQFRIPYNDYFARLLPLGLIKELHQGLVISLKLLEKDKTFPREDLNQFWFMSALAQYVAHSCQLLDGSVKILLKDNEHFLTIFSKLTVGFFAKFFTPNLTLPDFKSLLIKALAEYPALTQAKRLKKLLEGNTVEEISERVADRNYAEFVQEAKVEAAKKKEKLRKKESEIAEDAAPVIPTQGGTQVDSRLQGKDSAAETSAPPLVIPAQVETQIASRLRGKDSAAETTASPVIPAQTETQIESCPRGKDKSVAKKNKSKIDKATNPKPKPKPKPKKVEDEDEQPHKRNRRGRRRGNKPKTVDVPVVKPIQTLAPTPPTSEPVKPVKQQPLAVKQPPAPQPQRFFSGRQEAKLILHKQAIIIPAVVLPVAIRDLVFRLYLEKQGFFAYREVDFALYGLTVAELVWGLIPASEYKLCIALSNLDLVRDYALLTAIFARLNISCVPDYNGLKLMLQDYSGIYALNVSLINYRPARIIFDCIEQANINVEGVCLPIAPLQTFYTIYGTEKAVVTLLKRQLSIISKKESMLFVTDFTAIFDLVYYELRFPEPIYTRDTDLLNLAQNTAYLHQCFCDYTHQNPFAAKFTYDKLVSLCSQFPRSLRAVVEKMDGIGALYALTEISGEPITKTSRFLAPFSLADNPHLQVYGLCLYMLMHYCMRNKEELKKDRHFIQQWSFNCIIDQVLVGQDTYLKEIIINWAIGEPYPVAIDDDNFFDLRAKMAFYYKHFGFEDIGRLQRFEVQVEGYDYRP